MILTTSLLLLLAATGSNNQESSTAIPYSVQQTILPGDSPEVIAEKAAKVLPRPNQSAWMNLERTFFIHFGPNTFRGVEWGYGQEDPSIFNPTAFDADQWLRTIKMAGGKMAILVCKHHDGLCLWPSRYTNHSVASSTWRNGKGNEVGDVAAAAHKYGIKLGVYLSPADLFQLRTNPKYPGGYYGNESPKLKSVIPTDPAHFKSDPSQLRKIKDGQPTFSYVVDDYNRYFLNQLYELLTEYGAVDEVWFDGANPDPSVHETYDYTAWYDLIRKLQPNATIAVKGPDVRWVGNEWGVGRETEWSVIPLSSQPEDFHWPDMQNGDLGGRDQLKPGSHLWWYPAEVNVPILYGWFWADKKPSRTAADLVNIYYQSVGRNGNWLLNLSPDTRGLIPENQVENLRLMSQVIDKTFAKDLSIGAKVVADTTNPSHPASAVLAKAPDSWWEAAAGQRGGQLTLDLPKAVTFDVVSLQEAINHRGQRIESFAIDTWDGAQWNEVTTATTVGHKRLVRLNSPATTSRVRVRILSSRLEPSILKLGLYKQAELIQPPVVSERGIDGSVQIGSPKGLTVVYTLDGSVPNSKSPKYQSPIPLPIGGELNAACIGPDGKPGMTETKRFSGYAPTGWKVIEPSANASQAIDGDPKTVWTTPRSTQPQRLTVDMGKVLQVAGLSYLPRQDRLPEGVVEEFGFETSLDGAHWTVCVDHGRFDNIKNNPILQEVRFTPVSARYFRFTGYRDVDKTGAVGIAEISVLPESKK